VSGSKKEKKSKASQREQSLMDFNRYKLLSNIAFYDGICIPLEDTASTPTFLTDFIFNLQVPK